MDNPLRFQLPRSTNGRRLDHVLEELVPGESKAVLQKWVRRGLVKLNGRKVVRSNVRLGGGETLLVHVPGRGQEGPPEPRVHHEDPDLAVLEKPSGLLTYATATRPEPSLSSFAVERFGPLPSLEDEDRPGIVHRLDRGTSGLILVARTAPALDDLREQFRRREVGKTYLAVVHGQPAESSFHVEAPLAPERPGSDRQRIDRSGKPARTEFEVLESGPVCSLVRCRPETGRRHQLRVHLHHAGHPILGDDLYRPRGSGGPRAPRLALHASGLSLRHPRTRASLSFESPLPEDLAGLSGPGS